MKPSDDITKKPPWTAPMCAVVSGILLALSFPKTDFHFLAWAAFVPMLWAVEGASRRRALFSAYLFGMVFLTILLYWINMVRYPASLGFVGGVLIFPLFFVVWLEIHQRVRRSVYPMLRFVAPAAAWSLMEWATSRGAFAFPWWALANSQTSNLPLIQTASVTGIWGVSFILMLSNIAVLEIVLNRKMFHRPFVALTAAIVVAAHVVGGVSMLGKEDSVRPVKIAVIQGGFKQEEKMDPTAVGDMLRAHIEMTRQAAGSHPDIIVWEETVTPLNWIAGRDSYAAFMSEVDSAGAMVVTGAYDYNPKTNDDFNSVVAFAPGMGIIGKYYKTRLVPFGEYLPYRQFFYKIPGMKKWIIENIYDNDTKAGTRYHVFNSPRGKFSSIVCFESALPQFAREFIRRGSQFVFVLTNDAWFGKTAGPYQHLSTAVLRAVESRRYYVQAANTGISAVIDPYGRRVSVSDLFTREILYADIYPRKGITPYIRFGDWFVWVCLLLTICGLTAPKRIPVADTQALPDKKVDSTQSVKRKSTDSKKNSSKKKK